MDKFEGTFFNVFKPGDLADPGGLKEAICEFLDEGRRAYVILDVENYVFGEEIHETDITMGRDRLQRFCDLAWKFIRQNKSGRCALIRYSKGRRGKYKHEDRQFIESEVLQVLIQNLDWVLG